MIRLSVIIVSYNVKYYLEQCLLSVLQASQSISTEVWVVDNASTDGTMEYLRPRFPQVHFLSNSTNKGFSAANNQAIQLSQGEYVLLLNPDTIVGEDVFEGCVNFLDAHPKAGATGVRMLHSDGSFAPESRRGVPTPFTSFCKMSGLCALFPYSTTFGRYYMRYLDADEPNQIEIISGAFNMIRRASLNQIGLLDERFFMYGEDIDLSYRLLMAGWENWYLPLNILHYKGESTKKNSFRYVHIFYNAMLLFFNKHYGKHYRMLGMLIKMAVCARAGVDMLLRLWYKLRCLLRVPPKPILVNYVSFEFDAQPIRKILDELRLQKSPRRTLETHLSKSHIVIRPNQIITDNVSSPC